MTMTAAKANYPTWPPLRPHKSILAEKSVVTFLRPLKGVLGVQLFQGAIFG
jgi:hypothetical protein